MFPLKNLARNVNPVFGDILFEAQTSARVIRRKLGCYGYNETITEIWGLSRHTAFCDRKNKLDFVNTLSINDEKYVFGKMSPASWDRFHLDKITWWHVLRTSCL